MSQNEQGRRAGAGELTFDAASIARHIAATLAEEGLRSLMLSAGLAQPCSPARLTVRTLLARFRLLLPDLEKTSGTVSAAGLFQVRQQESKAGEQGMYRKSDLTHSATKRQISATYIWTQSPPGPTGVMDRGVMVGSAKPPAANHTFIP